MPQDAFMIRRVAAELNGLLLGGKVNKINQPIREGVVLSVYAGGRNYKLELNAHPSDAGAYLSTADYVNPQSAPNFCMLLRKHLIGAEITKIEQLNSERIIAFTFFCKSEFTESSRVLYAEIMGKYSNLILTENDLITGALKQSSIEEHYKRVLFSGAKYLLPTPQDKADIANEAATRERLASFFEGELSSYLFKNVSGIAFSTSKALCDEFFNGFKKPSFDADEFCRYLTDSYFNKPTEACCVVLDGKLYDYFSFIPFEEQGAPRYDEKSTADATESNYVICFDSVLSAQNYFHKNKTDKKRFDEKRRELNSVILSAQKKVEKRLAVILEKELECKNADELKKAGELIYANIHAIKPNSTGFETVDYYAEGCPKIKIVLDGTLSASQNAQRYFKKYNKLKRTLSAITPQRAAAEKELEYVLSVAASLASADEYADLTEIEREAAAFTQTRVQPVKKKKEVELPFREYCIEGFTVLCGRNNVQNDRLLRYASGDDLWLHTQKYHSSHVIIRTEGKDVPDGVLLACCEICAYFSEGRVSDKIPVDYTLRRYVKKPPKSNLGYVTYTEFKTALVKSDKHAELLTVK